MTAQQAIVVFPDFDAAARIEAVRRRFDPQAALLAAHVTLVFPFPAAADREQLHDHVAAAVAHISPFAIRLAEPTVEEGQYLFLRVQEGGAVLTTLHDRLYSGLLAPYRSRTHEYHPHVTVGRLDSAERAVAVVVESRAMLPRSMQGWISSVAIFSMHDDSVGSVDLTVPLNESR